MATIREKGPCQWHVQVRRRGWPTQSKTLRTRKEAEGWAREVEVQMDKAVFVDRTPAERTTFREGLERYLVEVTDKRPGAESRRGERARIEIHPRGARVLRPCRRKPHARAFRGLARSPAETGRPPGKGRRPRPLQAGRLGA
jgi:hypothetical protein